MGKGKMVFGYPKDYSMLRTTNNKNRTDRTPDTVERINREVLIVKIIITHNTRILFDKALLYKSIRFIFTCEKSLYSQSELRTAISHVEV